MTFDIQLSMDHFDDQCLNNSSTFTFCGPCDLFVPMQVPNLVFLAVSPEEKELWVNAINAAIIRAKNRVLDEVGGLGTVLVLSWV